MMCRSAGVNYNLETFNQNILEKMEKHPILNCFIDSLKNTVTIKNNSITTGELREWIRLLFIQNNYYTLNYMLDEMFSNCSKDDSIKFDAIYDIENFCKVCASLLQKYEIPIYDKNKEVKAALTNFLNILSYKNIREPWDIVSKIENNVDCELKLNVIEEAWLDDYLITKFNVIPIIEGNYPKTIFELKKLYKL
jgi:hypothetical protein